MDITRALDSVTVVVEDQDRALAFYRDVLGLEVRTDTELWPGARWVEVAPAGSDVTIALLTADGGLPLGVRYRTPDAERAHRALTAAGVTPDQDVLVTDYAPPMFTFADPEGNTVILIQEDEVEPGSGGGTGSDLAVGAVLAAVPVRSLDGSLPFYERLFGRPADQRPMPEVAEWHHDGGVLQVVTDTDRAGGGLVTLQLPGFEAALAALRERGVDVEGTPVRGSTVLSAYASLVDPDGNGITLVGL